MGAHSTVLFLLLLASSSGLGLSSDKAEDLKRAEEFASSSYLSKGGVGAIPNGPYIDLKSSKNELRLSEGKKWLGKGRERRQTVVFFEGRIWTLQSVPDGFDLSKAIVISFEVDKVRFFDFSKFRGGYYRRPLD